MRINHNGQVGIIEHNLLGAKLARLKMCLETKEQTKEKSEIDDYISKGERVLETIKSGNEIVVL